MKALVLCSGSSHGAFQAGVLKALDELGWNPDLVLGASVGSINGVAYASGMSGHAICDLWLGINNKDIYKRRPLRDWPSFLSWNYLLDTSPLKKFLEHSLDLDALYESDIISLVTGLNVKTGRQNLFSSHLGKAMSPLRNHYKVCPLDHDSILASSAIPGIFPSVNGIWDGAFQQHNPLKPAVLMGVDEILVVHLNVEGGGEGLPKGIVQTALRIANLSSSYHVVSDLKLLKERNALSQYRTIKSRVICPDESLGYSRLNFDDVEKKKEAIESGYARAYSVMDS